MKKYLLEETRRCPTLTPQDVVKLCYQAAFGAEHALSDLTHAHKYFQDEYAATPEDDKPLANYIAPNVCRVNLSAWKRLKLNPGWLWNLFASATKAENTPEDGSTVFTDYLAQAGELSQAKTFPFPYSQWQEYISDYKKGAVRHSAVYRDNHKPAYRILSGMAAMALPIFEAMAGLNTGVIAIDGRAASGKTTLAGYLRDIIPAGGVAMDDFFLPPELRTTERLKTPGGNIHHERFIQEVIPYLKSSKGFKYNSFDCSQMEYAITPTEVAPYPWCIVEGVYSFHPALGNYMDIRVFLDIHPAKQKSRIEARNSANMAVNYLTKWIPMEEAYFKEYGIRESADIVIQH